MNDWILNRSCGISKGAVTMRAFAAAEALFLLADASSSARSEQLSFLKAGPIKARQESAAAGRATPPKAFLGLTL